MVFTKEADNDAFGTCAHACARFSPEGSEAHTPNHVEKRVKYEQTQQQIEEHGLRD